MNLDHHFAPLLDVFPGSAEGERGGGGSERGARGGERGVQTSGFGGVQTRRRPNS